MPLNLPLERDGGLRMHMMLCGRGLRTSHKHRPITTYPLQRYKLFLNSASILPIFLSQSLQSISLILAICCLV